MGVLVLLGEGRNRGGGCHCPAGRPRSPLFGGRSLEVGEVSAPRGEVGGALQARGAVVAVGNEHFRPVGH